MKDFEKIAVVLALGATAFVLWKSFLQGKTIGDFGNKAPNVPTTAPATQATGALFTPTVQGWNSTLANDPNASAGIRGIYSSTIQ